MSQCKPAFISIRQMHLHASYTSGSNSPVCLLIAYSSWSSWLSSSSSARMGRPDESETDTQPFSNRTRTWPLGSVSSSSASITRFLAITVPATFSESTALPFRTTPRSSDRYRRFCVVVVVVVVVLFRAASAPTSSPVSTRIGTPEGSCTWPCPCVSGAQTPSPSPSPSPPASPTCCACALISLPPVASAGTAVAVAVTSAKSICFVTGFVSETQPLPQAPSHLSRLLPSRSLMASDARTSSPALTSAHFAVSSSGPVVAIVLSKQR
jgi:hypothetical protein